MTDKPAIEADDTKGKEKRLRQLCIEETILKGSNLSLRDVVGLAEAKQALQEAVIMPLVFPHLFLGEIFEKYLFWLSFSQ